MSGSMNLCRCVVFVAQNGKMIVFKINHENPPNIPVMTVNVKISLILTNNLHLLLFLVLAKGVND